MANLTYRQLVVMIFDLPEDHLDDNVTVFDSNEGESFGIKDAEISGENGSMFGSDIFDDGCLVLIEDR